MKQPRNITTDVSTSGDVWRELKAAEAGIFDQINGLGQQIRDLNGDLIDDIPDFGDIPPYPEQYSQNNNQQRKNNQQPKTKKQGQSQYQRQSVRTPETEPVNIPVHQQRGATGLPIAKQRASNSGVVVGSVTFLKVLQSFTIATVCLAIIFGMVIGSPNILIGLLRFVPLVFGGFIGLRILIVYRTIINEFPSIFETSYFNIALEAMVLLIAISLAIYLAPHVYPFLVNIGK